MNCASCKHYRVTIDGPYCFREGKARPTSPILIKDCHETKEQTKMEEIVKTCPRCGRTLPVKEFGRHSKTKDGYQPICRDCRSAAMNGGKAAKQKAKKEEKPVVTLNRAALNRATVEQLVEELKSRGYHGTLQYTIEL